jgi:hypothetical protein
VGGLIKQLGLSLNLGDNLSAVFVNLFLKVSYHISGKKWVQQQGTTPFFGTSGVPYTSLAIKADIVLVAFWRIIGSNCLCSEKFHMAGLGMLNPSRATCMNSRIAPKSFECRAYETIGLTTIYSKTCKDLAWIYIYTNIKRERGGQIQPILTIRQRSEGLKTAR